MADVRKHLKELKNIDTDVGDFCAIAKILGFELEYLGASLDEKIMDTSNGYDAKIKITCRKTGLKGILTKKSTCSKCFLNDINENVVSTSNFSDPQTLLPSNIISKLLIEILKKVANSEQDKPSFTNNSTKPVTPNMCTVVHPLHSSTPEITLVNSDNSKTNNCAQCNFLLKQLNSINSIANKSIKTASNDIRRISDIKPVNTPIKNIPARKLLPPNRSKSDLENRRRIAEVKQTPIQTTPVNSKYPNSATVVKSKLATKGSVMLIGTRLKFDRAAKLVKGGELITSDKKVRPNKPSLLRTPKKMIRNKIVRID